jgi:hypothetical protein
MRPPPAPPPSMMIVLVSVMDTGYRRILCDHNMIQGKHQPRKCERKR